MTAAIILAAGASTRFGSPKQMAVFQGERLLERAVRTAREAGCSPIIVVLGANAREIQDGCDLTGARVCINDLWQEGMGSSLRLGIATAVPVEGAIVMTCDMPTVSSHHLRALMTSNDAIASRYAGRRGVPAFFPAASFPELLSVQGDAGARDLLRTATSIDLPDGEADIDTPGDLIRLVQSPGIR